MKPPDWHAYRVPQKWLIRLLGIGLLPVDGAASSAQVRLRSATATALQHSSNKLSASPAVWLRSNDTDEGEGKVAGQREDRQELPSGAVRLQVPEADMKKFVSELSPRCGRRFSAMLRGEAPQVGDFGKGSVDPSQSSQWGAGHANSSRDDGSQLGVSAEASCAALNGSLCVTEARVTQEASSGIRKMQSSTVMKGQSCLANECTTKKDLQLFATFMHLKAKEVVVGTHVRVELDVDCTAHGGSQASVATGDAAMPPRHSGAGRLPLPVPVLVVSAIGFARVS
mmetsp:Transcript_70841/g.153856  ORF Transcript_70841/g.153856 Transcript_70841/m.153856 type:complete len:283 (-) Transcript_70841:108-956(-)